MTIVATNGRKWGIMVIDYKKVGLKIKEVRLKKNLSQECLAEKCNLSSAYRLLHMYFNRLVEKEIELKINYFNSK